MAKRFLASVANVELFERVNGELRHFASAHTLTDSSIGFQISMEDVRGGQGAKLFGRFGHTTGMTLQLTDAMFDINYLRLNLGAKQSSSLIASILATEQKVWDGGDIILDNSAVSVGHLCGLNGVLCWGRKVSCKSGTSSEVPLQVSGEQMRTISASQLSGKFVVNDVITISYFKNDPTAILYDVSATFLPGEVVAIMTANEYAGDTANVTTGEPVGQLIVKIPRLQLDGQFDIGLNMSSAATIALNGSALASVDPVTGKEYYAEILETNHNPDFRTDLIGVAIDQTSANMARSPIVYGIYKDGSHRVLDNLSITHQLIKSISNPEGKMVNGFIKQGVDDYVQVGLSSNGKWASAGNWYVAVFPYIVTDEEYDAIQTNLEEAPIVGNYGIIGSDSVVCTTAEPSVGLEYVSNGDGTCNVVGIGVCADTYLVIPESSPSGDIVEGVGDNAFENQVQLTTVVFPASPNFSIGSGSFAGCTGITSMDIPNNVTFIGSGAFSGCTNLKMASLPNGGELSAINGNLFSGCTELASIVIPDSVTDIYAGAFSNCSSLKRVVVGSGVEGIAEGVFSGCSSLEEITIPFVGGEAGKTENDTYQYPFGYIFGEDSYTGGVATQQTYYGSSTSSTTTTTYYIPASLRSVTVTGGNILFGAFENCTGLTSVTIGNGVMSIGGYAFLGCTGLTSVTIPENVASIGNYAFRNCTELTSVVWNATNCTSAGSSSRPIFYGCSNLTTVTFGDNVENIPSFAFYSCSGLTSITIPDCVTSIGSSAFSGCTGLTSVYYTGDVAGWCGIEFGSVNANPLYYAHNLYINDEFVIDLVIPDGVTSIGGSAFYGCTGLTSVTIGNGVTSIGNFAFRGCTGLTFITIPDGVTSIGNSAFSGCTGLTSVTIGNGVTSIGSDAFSGCTGLTSVTIGNGVTSIGNYAFSGCTGLTSVVISDSLESIGGWVFDDCLGLTSMVLLAIEPPAMDVHGIFGYHSTYGKKMPPCMISVPAASVDTYKSASGWSDYAEYIQAISS